MKFTIEQLQVIKNRDRRILVKAGAGTGKTEILIRRIIDLIEEDPTLSIKEMAIITFTNKASEELRSRLKNALYKKIKKESDIEKKIRFRYELESLNSSQISTIHKFCSSLLESFGPYFDDDITYSPVYKVRSGQLSKTINQTIEKWINMKSNKNKSIEHLKYMPIHHLNEIIQNVYTMIRTKGLDLQTILLNTRRTALFEMETTKKNIKLELVEILEMIEKNHRKYKYGRLDVDDLLEFCSKILEERSDLCKMVQSKYKYIFIDEFQDTSLYQAHIVKRLCNGSPESPSLFLVGDIKQSIYEFRGADLESYGEIENWIKQTGSVLTLSTNWRSSTEIVHYINLVFDRIKENERYLFQHEHLNPSVSKENINLSDAHDWLLVKKNENQGDKIATYIKDKINEGYLLSDFTVLVRKNYELKLISEKMREHSLPCKIVGGSNFFNQREIIDVYRVLKSIINRENTLLIYEANSTIFFENQSDSYDHIISEILNEELVYKLTPSQLIDFIYRKTMIFKRCSLQEKANLNKLKELTRNLVKNENISLYHYVNWLYKMIVSKADEPLADYSEETNDSIQVMTIHKAKGLEFPVVILPHLDSSISQRSLNPEIVVNKSNFSLDFNYNFYFDKKSTISSNFYEEVSKNVHFNVYSEELRVLYVALTRAKKKLVFIGSEGCKKNKICFQNWLRIGL